MAANPRIPAEVFELSAIMQEGWSDQLANLEASGVPLNATISNSEITRTDTGSGLGTLIPEAERKEIIKSLPAQSAALRLARNVQMSTKVEHQPVLSSLPTAYWVNGDDGLKNTTKAQWGNKKLTAEELAVIVPVPEAVLNDSNYDIFGEVRPLIVEAIGAALDLAVLFGTSAPSSFNDKLVPDAISHGNFINRGSVTPNDLAEEVNQVMAKVENDGFNVSGFAARTRLKSRLRGLRTTGSGELLFQPSLQVGTPDSLYGEPLEYVDQNGAWNAEGIDLIAGDWSKAVVGIRQDITFKLFTEGVISDDSGNVVLNLMQQDSVALRVVARYGFAVANPINRLNQVDASRYPFAVLETTEGS